MLNSDRHLFLTGEPGSGKSEVIVHAACAAAKSGACVLAQNIDSLKRTVHFYDSTSGRGQKYANALQTKKIDFLAGKCTFLHTEEDLDVAWERKY